MVGMSAIAHAQADSAAITAHPPGLSTLFLTELWERFSYYGMRAILMLFMVAPVADGGLGFDTPSAASLYGTYTMLVYMLGLPGGLLADRWLGARRAVLVGGCIIACGHFVMTVHALPYFYAGLGLIAVGTGLLKPSISTMVGSLYAPGDKRRDSGFSLFYMGINVGAVLAPLVCGWLAEGAGFQSFLIERGFDPKHSWHWGFGAAGVGMIVGLGTYLLQGNRLPQAGPARVQRDKVVGPALTQAEWLRIGAITILFFFTILFWAAYEQKGASLNLFAKQLVRTELFGRPFPASWLQSLTPFYVILLAPIAAKIWLAMGDRQPSSARKFSLGLAAIGAAFCILTFASSMTAMGKISPLWLAAFYLFDVVGEVCLSPVGLSTVTKLAPVKLVGLMMGAWFFATSLGNKLAGFLSGYFVANDASVLVRLYGGIAVALLAAAVLLYFLTPRLQRMAGRED
jgi:proton-dependent oligopeptide transporter, POT family